ncbi:MAG: transposase [Novosphingobium sp.]|uniref:transposase n=1 Tax=Novosphingobium sp. TaxID=1874826 RepID=UPI0012BE36A0|nr:transposase [Novosphingobium sp.]MPS70385.1 transposase [Novosphingobium sp.]
MARVMAMRDPTVASLAEFVDAISGWGFDPREEVSLSHAANWLQRLGNDRTFLGDLLVDMLAGLSPVPDGADALAGVGPESIMLVTPGQGNFFLNARIWPAPGDSQFRASGPEAFGYGQAHDHNYDLLALGYFGPGYLSDEYEYDREAVSWHVGQSVQLRPQGPLVLEQGRIFHYRAQRDVHVQHPPASLSVALNLVHTQPGQAWMDHCEFDIERGTVTRLLGHGPSESFLRIAVALGGEEALDIASRFGKSHPSDRMRLVAWDALASGTADAALRDAVWRDAEQCGSRWVAAEARKRRGEEAARQFTT